MKVTDSDRAAIRAIIERQLQAFQNDDAKGAFAFASPGIQKQVGSPENFMLMVKIGYPAVYRPRSVLFENITIFDGALTQPVLLLRADGVPIKALYLMEKQSDDTWRVGSCYLLPIERQAV